MATVVPPPPSSGPPPSAPAPVATVTVTNPPPALTQLALGGRIEGTVQGQGGTGQVQVRTPLGALAVQTATPLPPGGILVLQLYSVAPQVRLQIVSINDEPLTPGPPPLSGATTGGPARTAASPTAAATAGPAAGPVTLTVGTTVTATLLTPSQPGAVPAVRSTTAPGTAPVPPAATPAPPGTASVAPGAAASATPGGAATGQASTPGTAPAAPRAAAHPAGSRFPVRIVALRPPAEGAGPALPASPGAAATLTPGSVLAATVTGATRAGQTIVQTPAGTMTLSTSTPLPAGSTLTVEVAARPVFSAAPQAPALNPSEAMIVSRDWPVLREAVAALQRSDPAAARQLTHDVIPQPGVRLAAGILFLLAALRGGGVRGWLGDSVARALQRAKPDVLSRLGDDFSGMERMAEEGAAREWRVVLIPLHTGAGIEQIRLLLRRHGEPAEDTEEGAKGGVRFILDVELSRMGRLQLDGLVRGGKARFDLMVRSARPLSAPMREDIRQIFHESTEATGTTGVIAFQSMPADFVELRAAGDAGRPGVVV